MKSIAIQFHGRVSEIIEFVQQVRGELRLSLTLMTLSPFRIVQLSENERFSRATIKESWWGADIRLALSLDSANIEVHSPNQYLDKNQGTVVLELGKETPDMLGESALMFRSHAGPEFESAKEVAKRLRTITSSGVVAVNPDTGDECLDKSHRYTKGAEAYFRAGKSLAPVAGKSILKIA